MAPTVDVDAWKKMKMTDPLFRRLIGGFVVFSLVMMNAQYIQYWSGAGAGEDK